MSIKTIVAGRVGKDAEMRLTGSGTPVASFSIVSERRWKDKAGNKQKKATWVRVTAWAGLAELVAKSVHKGDLVYVEGEQLEAGAYINREQEAVGTIELTLDKIDFLHSASRQEGDSAPVGGDDGDDDDTPF